MKPEVSRDFNVPTPIVVEDRIFVVTENNGARVSSIKQADMTKPADMAKPADMTDKNDFAFTLALESSSDLLSGDSHSPVRIGKWVAGIDRDLVILDPLDGLMEIARFEDKSLQGYVSLMVDGDRIWASTGDGTQLLLRVSDGATEELGRFRALDGPGEIFAHPAFCGGVLYVRGPTWLDAYSVSR